MVGFAVTATQDTTSAGDDRALRLPEVLDLVHAAPKPAILVVQYTGADRLRSCVAGDMFCTALQKLGAVGLVTDMGSRDFGGIQRRAPGFQLFCPGAVVSHGYARSRIGYNGFDLWADHSTGRPVARGRQRCGVDPSRYRRRRYCPGTTCPGGGENLLRFPCKRPVHLRRIEAADGRPGIAPARLAGAGAFLGAVDRDLCCRLCGSQLCANMRNPLQLRADVNCQG